MLADFRHSLRQLLRNPGFSVVVLLVLALCIGANTAIYSLIYGLLLKPPPIAEPDRMVNLYATYPKSDLPRLPGNVVFYLDYKAHAASYQSLGLWRLDSPRVGKGDATTITATGTATADIFDVLQIHPLIGSFFTLANSEPGNDHVVVLTESYWRSVFGGDPDVVGRTLVVNGDTMRIVGVAPRTLEAFDSQVRLVRPYSWTPAQTAPERRHWDSIWLFGRLKPGVTAVQAQAEANGIERHYYDTQATAATRLFIDQQGAGILVEGYWSDRSRPYRSNLILVQAGAVLVLIIGCVNVANLMLARANRRRPEAGIKLALGAGAAAILRQPLFESLLLSVGGAGLGLILAHVLLAAANGYLRRAAPWTAPVGLDLPVFAVLLVAAVGIGVLIAAIPAAFLWGSDPLAILRGGNRSQSATGGMRALSSVLIVSQVALALALLVGAGLLGRSLEKALQVPTGFDAPEVISGNLSLPSSFRTGKPEDFHRLQDRVEAALQAIPGVDSVAFAQSKPYGGAPNVNAFSMAEPGPGGNDEHYEAYNMPVSPGYFATLRIPLIAGRFFRAGDGTPGHEGYVVDQNFARRYFPGRSAVGGRFTFGGPPKTGTPWPTIIGVVGDVPYNGIEDASGIPFVYYPMPQAGWRGSTFILRTGLPFAESAAMIRAKLRAVDPELILTRIESMPDVISDSHADRRGVALLVGGFSLLALFLAAIGIYSVLAYDVSQRTREIGIRGALGASRGEIVLLILRQGLAKTVLGIAAGLVGAFVLCRLMASLLYQVQPTDPASYAAALIALLLVAAAASLLPALRATRINPSVALRAE